MRTKVVAVILLAALLSASFAFVVSASSSNEKSKGGLSDFAFDVSRGKPSKPSSGIATGTPIAVTGDRYAIVIGISDYAGTANDLDYCDDDARDFIQALPSGYVVTELLNGGAKREDILGAISALSTKVGPNDQVIFFYSGHGSTGIANDGDSERKDECVVPYEATAQSLIWDGELKAAFSGFTCRIMFYFDSCYAGGMTDLAGPNRLICMACGENQLSLESSAWSNGQFTYYFVDQGMKNGLANANEDDYVTFEEAFDYAKAHCQKQTPIASDSFTNDMLP